MYLCLCRHANENAECHPSFTRLAEECGLSRRSTNRTIHALASYHLIQIISTLSEKGDLNTNIYTILEIPEISPHQGTYSHQGSDSQSLGVVSISHLKETNKKETNLRNTTTTPTPSPPNFEPYPTQDCGGSKLIYPKELLSEEREEAAKMLEEMGERAQLLLDELAGQLKAKEIKNPLGYLRGLIAKAEEGKFSATAGIKIKENRKQRARIEASIKASQERATKPLEEPRREERWRQLDKLRKLRESLGSTAHP